MQKDMVSTVICELSCDTSYIAPHEKDVVHSEQLRSEMPLLQETLKEMTSYIPNTTNKYVMHTILINDTRHIVYNNIV